MSSYDDALKRRMEDNYKTREGERKFTMYFKPDSQLPLWTAGKGEHGVDIIPYPAGKNDPAVVLGKMKEGEPTYCLDIYVHQNIGPRDEVFVCLDYNYKQPCPVCEYRNKLLKEQPESERQKEKLDKLTDALKPKRRVAYNVIVVTNREEENKGLRVWEISHYHMERELQTLAGRGKARGKGYVFFAHPQEGKTVWFDRTGVGPTSTKYAGYAFEDRDYDIDQKTLDEAYVLDEHIHIPTYEEVYEALWDKSGGDGSGPDDGEGVRGRRRREGGDDEDGGGDDGETRRRPRRTRDSADDPPPEDEEAQVRSPRRGRSQEDEGEGDGGGRRSRRGRSQEDEDEGEGDGDGESRRPRRSRSQEDEGDGDGGSRRGRGRNRDDEGDDPPRGRSRDDEGDGEGDGGGRRSRREPEPEPESEKPRRLGKAGMSSRRGGGNDDDGGGLADDKCPVPNGRFGVDTDKFEECESCDFWDSCVKASERGKR